MTLPCFGPSARSQRRLVQRLEKLGRLEGLGGVLSEPPGRLDESCKEHFLLELVIALHVSRLGRWFRRQY